MLPGQQFLSADEYTRRLGRRANAEQARDAISLYWRRVDVPRFYPTEVADSSVAVRVNFAAWLIVCECGGAQLGSKTDHRFLCLDCLNEQVGGKWRGVRWPEDVAGIEAALRPRLTDNAHWLEGETVADLLAENERKGLTA